MEMNDTTTTVLAIALIFIGLPVLVLWLNDRRRNTRRDRDRLPEIRDAERRAHEQRILQPDWSCVERHLGRPVPQALRELYADLTLITRQDLNYTAAQAISTFEPLDERAMLDAEAWLGFEAVAIATNDFGDAIYLRPGAAETDTVYLTLHDGGGTEVFAESVTTMRETLERANRTS
jgi:hypothetical protein